MSRPTTLQHTETSAEIFERRRKEASEYAADTDRVADPMADPDALYAQRRRRAGHTELLADLT